MLKLLADMEINGIKIDSSFLNVLSKKFNNKIVKLEKEIFKISKREFNIGSPKQLGEVLYNELKSDLKIINQILFLLLSFLVKANLCK